MLNQEEIEAIKALKSYTNAIDTFGTIDYKCINNLYAPAKTVLNLISKLQKELKEQIHKKTYARQNIIYKNKQLGQLRRNIKELKRAINAVEKEKGEWIKENEEKDKQINLIIDKINKNFNSIFLKHEIDEIKNIYNKIKNTSELTGLDLRKDCIKIYFKNLAKGDDMA